MNETDDILSRGSLIAVFITILGLNILNYSLFLYIYATIQVPGFDIGLIILYSMITSLIMFLIGIKALINQRAE